MFGINASGDALRIIGQLGNDRPHVDHFRIGIEAGADVPSVAEVLPADGLAVHQGEQVNKLPMGPAFIVLQRDLLLVRLIPVLPVDLQDNRELREGGRVCRAGVFAQILPHKAETFCRPVDQAGQLRLQVHAFLA